jgi:hypothetical protein
MVTVMLYLRVAAPMIVVMLALAACATPQATPGPAPVARPAPRPDPVAPPPPVAPRPTPIADAYRAAASTQVTQGLASHGAYDKLLYLTDRIGARLSGSRPLDEAIAWAQDTMRKEGQANVHAEKVMVQHWVRGAESGAIIAPVRRPLHLLQLGRSPGTGGKPLTGEVVVVTSYEELTALGAAGVKGKIVLFNHVMPPYTERDGARYGDSSPFRMRGPARASRLGAKAALVRSITAHSLSTPHTGLTQWAAEQPPARPIPAVSLTVEDAELIARLARQGPVKVTLTLEAQMRPDVASANVVGEIVGSQAPEQVVLLGAHLDSWDVGQGAHDDGAGCVIMMEALNLVRHAGLSPRRTLRVVLFTNEEDGLAGSEAYHAEHQAELGKHVAAFESDSGGFAPRGLSYSGKEGEAGLARCRDLAALFAPLHAASCTVGYSGTDIDSLGHNVARFGLAVDGSTYFDIHHSPADTIDKVDPDLLQLDAVLIAIAAYVMADLPADWGSPL